MSDAGLYRLLAWLSPGYPVGAFAYSHGVEWAVEEGRVTDAETLCDWIRDLLRHGGGWTDAVVFSHAYDAAEACEPLARLNALALALAPSRERLLETAAQGTAFLKTTTDAWPWPGVEQTAATLKPDVAYPVAVAAAARGHGVPKEAALSAFLHGFAANLTSAGVRLIPLGQTAGQQIIARLEPLVGAVSQQALRAALDDLGGVAILSDIASMRHETQYTRLFRS